MGGRVSARGHGSDAQVPSPKRHKKSHLEHRVSTPPDQEGIAAMTKPSTAPIAQAVPSSSALAGVQPRDPVDISFLGLDPP